MHGGGPNDFLLVHLADTALRSTAGLERFVALERRHPDGRRWVQIARFATEADAEAARASLVDGGHVQPSEIRVREVRVDR